MGVTTLVSPLAAWPNASRCICCQKDVSVWEPSTPYRVQVHVVSTTQTGELWALCQSDDNPTTRTMTGTWVRPQY